MPFNAEQAKGHRDYGFGDLQVKCRPTFFGRPRYYLENSIERVFGPYTTTWVPHETAFWFKTEEEAEAAAVPLRRTWIQTYPYEITVPFHVCKGVCTAYDGVKHFYLRGPYAREAHDALLGDFHGFYRHPREGGTNYIGVKTIADAIIMADLAGRWSNEPF